MATPSDEPVVAFAASDDSAPDKKAAKRKSQYRPEHALQFGVRPMSDPPVLKVQCLFCVHFGREILEPEKRLREATKNVKYWRPPYRAELYHKHHQRQHLTLYTAYERLSHREKVAFFLPENVARLHQTTTGAKMAALKHVTTNLSEPPYMWKQLFDVPVPRHLHALADSYSQQVLAGPPLEPRCQALCSLAMLMGQPHMNASMFEMQISAALSNNVPRLDIVHVILTAAPVIGVPAMLSALELAHRVFTAASESDEEEAGDGSDSPQDVTV
ncbi:hypothetical protein SPRG_11820 [Saprolegnia parasitica CBS 223.65]|uniref:Carboxymuconolactone decarboxylase-like domain-containing protein n=1 Tax=Saprolegnia parasitica (strain CBS 223.65) TaxID=695850 RepID=A0A067BXF6_SAPPC|nr:hypothetical protein SPRG_11820 [Saprolegnia parasitica CBS 223.65]KDO22973.1 hypothetical protein SPRG_11820 [Saprolegnia parasitica CBS 223.65]|eukprot:XP_012206264.1 hypothetical protein SPRG_11820 [Saprolegnia parasitica CBS 223.65]